jgi:aminoglycoside 6'-N-acetyltransferase
MTPMLYTFTRMTDADLPMVGEWLRGVEVSRWWGPSDEQLKLIADDLKGTPMRQWIVDLSGRPFAYVQAYPARSWPQSHLMHLPADAEAIDAFIGDPKMIGRGHGRAFLRVFAEMLIADGASIVAIDPDVSNARAKKAYKRAGFVGDEVIETADGPVSLMLFSKL